MAFEVTFSEAIRQALQEEMRRDPTVFLMGEDIGSYGGIFKVTKGLLEEFGEQRVIETPLAESAIVGAGVGAAMMGMRPVVEIQFTDLLTIPMDQIVNNAAKMCYLSNGKFTVPLVIRAVHGAGSGAGAHHSQSAEAWFANVPGLKIVFPSSPMDAKGLLKTSIQDGNPVLFFEHKKLYFTKGSLPEEEVTIPLGKAAIRKEGKDLTVVATGAMVHEAIAAAQSMGKEGMDVEVLDPRTLVPLDTEAILASVRKTSRVLIVEEAPKMGGFGAQIAALVSEQAFDYLDARVCRVAAPDTPVPANKTLERRYVPDADRIVAAIRDLMR